MHRAFGYNRRVNGGTALIGAVLLAATALHGQTGTVCVRVIDSKGAAMPEAAVSLAHPWDRTVRTLPANRIGEVLFKKLSFGEWFFRGIVAAAPGGLR
jgi:hypothetical protein